MSDGPINFYSLSTGYCGTRYYHHALRPATNAEIWHQPGHDDIAEVTFILERRLESDPDAFVRADLAEFPNLMRRIDKRLALPWVYGDTLNWMRSLACMLYKHIGPQRLRLVELVRHPVAACRSMLAAERRSASDGVSDLALAEEMARRWVRQYTYIRQQLRAIDKPQVCRTIRLEDTGLEQIRDLYDFLGLEGFDAEAVTALLGNTSRDIRHSHRQASDHPASREELRAIWQVCGPLAAQYGYAEDERMYNDAPSRPVRAAAAQPMTTEEAERRPTTVKLWNCRGLGLIVRGQSGVTYVNQAGGPICFWANAEGAYVPLAEDGERSPARTLFEYFSLRRDKEFMRSIRTQDADFIDRVLAEHGLANITVNRSRIGETWDVHAWETWTGLFEAPWEAWAPVRVAPSPYSRVAGVLSGPEMLDAVLVWENSN